MNRSRLRVVFIVAGTAMGTGISGLVAFPWGADPGLSGGPAGYEVGGGNCTVCHVFHMGPGRVELFGAPQRYRAGAVYDLTVRVTDPEQLGAGFEISAEGPNGHLGAFNIIDFDHTRNAGFSEPIRYVTHTQDGYDESLLDWGANDGWYEYHLGWEAPAVDTGPVTFFVAGNAVNNADFFDGDRYYATHATLQYAEPGDGDGDTDLDLRDFAVLQGCFSGTFPASGDGCEYVDFDGDGSVSLTDVREFVTAVTGPTATLPAGYVLADSVRGGLLYDKWWKVNGATEPVGNHALYPDIGQQAGSATFRCKECHGWDYKGRDGAYGSGSHFTGIVGVEDTTLTAQELFDLLKADSAETGGHNMDAYGMSGRDLWDVVKMALEGTIDTDEYINMDGTFIGNADPDGNRWYSTVCFYCHGFDGTDINFGTEAEPEYVGTIAAGNPWEFLHTVRFGHPASPMPSLDLLGWPLQRAADIGAYAATLPTD